MPRKFPAEIENYLAQYEFSKHVEIFWVRALVLDVNAENSVREDIAGTNRREEKVITLVDVYDVDAIDLSNINRNNAIKICLDNIPRHFGIEEGDVISVFGHRPVGSTTVKPRYMINHNTGKSNRAFYDVKIDGERHDQFWSPVIAHTWLKSSYTRKAKFSERIKSAFTCGCVLYPILIVSLSLIWVNFPSNTLKAYTDTLPIDTQINITAVASVIFIIIFLLIGWASSKEETFGVDLTEHYKHIAVAIHRPGHFRSPGFEDRYRG